MHGGALGMVSLVAAAAGGGISGGGRAEILASDSSVFFRCGWEEEGSAVPHCESEAPGDGVPPAVVELEVGQRLVRVAFSGAAAGSERHSSAPLVGQVELVWLCH